MPTECPAQSVMALVMRKRRKASQVKVSGPRIRAIEVSAPVHRDFAGTQMTFPLTASLPGPEIMRAVDMQVMTVASLVSNLVIRLWTKY